MDLIEKLAKDTIAKKAPLADRMRPRNLGEFIGQKHIVGEGKLLRRAVQSDTLGSCIFFGPPGCGKTSLAEVIANTTQSFFVKLNAVQAGVKDVREVIAKAENNLLMYNKSTYLLLDECHRWSKSQSDSILPAMEKGIIKFVGSTTENPMVAMTSAIISRSRVFQFYPLSVADVKIAMTRALDDKEKGLGKHSVIVDDEAFDFIAHTSNGDIRMALNALELAVLSTPISSDGKIHLDISVAQDSMQKKTVLCDDEDYYNMLSAFIKSMRGSDPDAALAWFARLIYAGVDPRLVIRRMIVHASEDVGLANPQALVQAVAAAKALETVGMPEARIPMAQAIIYICNSPKSNAVVQAIEAAMADAESSFGDSVPVHLRDTSYTGAKVLGNGKGYKYPHDYPDHFVEQDYMPVGGEGKKFYFPSDQGEEAGL